MKGDELDPKALIRDAYLIDGISAAECRSIFLDWALSVPAGVDPKGLIETLLARHSDAGDAHPMTQTLREGLGTVSGPKRRGGRAGRLGQ